MPTEYDSEGKRRKAKERTGLNPEQAANAQKNPLGENAWGGRFLEDYDRTRGAGAELTGAYVSGIQEDPRQAYRTSATAAIDEFKDAFGLNLRNLRHSQVGSGRVDTGFGYRDEDVLFRGMSRDLIRDLNQRALDAEAINQERLRSLGGIGYEYNRDALEASSGSWQTLRQQRLANKASKRSFWGRLLGGALTAVGTVGGALIGGPAGAAAGAAAGKAVSS